MAEGNARDHILGRVYRAVGSAQKDPERRKAVARRLASHPSNLVPKRSFGDRAHRFGLFWKMVEEVKATTERVNSADDVPAAVAGYLREHNLPQRLRHGEDALLNDLPWAKKAPSLEVSTGPAIASDDVSVSHAFAGTAETGTLVLV
ncbi:MAG: lactate utilization protein, partial [Pseudomonadota bacterium]